LAVQGNSHSTPYSVNIFSIWRFATTIKTGAATYPTFDPTWYGPITIVMAGLETASACICASIPVFWGPLVASASHLFGQIFVTQEVRVTTHDRFDDLESKEVLGDMEMRGVPRGYSVDNGCYASKGGGSQYELVGKTGV
jgi:L-alanine-DL-glutamate epimerase-like enolase superfamily enzyme